MGWKFRDIDISEIGIGNRPREKYAKLYERIFQLKVGKGFEVEMDSRKEAENARNCVHNMLKNKGLLDKYVASNSLNIFKCGRVK